jgi:hypothetical protein
MLNVFGDDVHVLCGSQAWNYDCSVGLLAGSASTLSVWVSLVCNVHFSVLANCKATSQAAEICTAAQRSNHASSRQRSSKNHYAF